MMNKTAPPPEYITDGLIFHLDGIDKGPNSGTWTDLIGGIEFTNTNVVATQYGWQFDGTAYFQSTTYIFPASDSYTLEICFKPASNAAASYGLLFSGTSATQNNILFYKSNNIITWLQRNRTFTYTIDNGSFHSISVNLDTVLCDNSVVSLNSGTDYWTSGNSNYTWIGVRGVNSNVFKGEIYSIRIYNRRLTQAEQINNYKADKGRFK